MRSNFSDLSTATEARENVPLRDGKKNWEVAANVVNAEKGVGAERHLPGGT